MTEHRRLKPPFLGSTPLSDWLPLGSVKRSLWNCESTVVKCVCPGEEVPLTARCTAASGIRTGPFLRRPSYDPYASATKLTTIPEQRR